MPVYCKIVILALMLVSSCLRAQEPPPVFLGLDAEFGLLNSTSAQSIERGIRVALDEINAAGGVLGGRPLRLLTRDNRSVPARGRDNIRRFAETADLVAVVGGRFSPVLLDEIALVHELQIPLLASWSSADGVTEHAYRPSFTFRLSLRDSYAMPAMLDFAVRRGARRIGLLVPNSGWGRSNAAVAQRFQEGRNDIELINPVWYNWGEKNMLRHYRQLLEQGMDTLLLVANDIEGAALVAQLAGLETEQWVPIVSHWGVTGGEMVEKSGPVLRALDFAVVQTFSLFNVPREQRERVMAVAARLFGTQRIEDVKAPVGFGHAYDLTHILARALELAGSTDRRAVRNALERVRDYQGLTGDYPQPFTPERHEAMRPQQVFMARYRDDGAIVPIASGPAVP